METLKKNTFPDEGIVDGVFIHDDIADTEISGINIYEDGKVPEDKKDDPNTVIIEPDPSYCNKEEHGNIDVESLLFDNTLMIASDDGRYITRSQEIFFPENVDPDVEEPFIAEDDPTYCDGDDHNKVDAEKVIYENVIMINTDDGFRAPLKDTYMKGHVPSSKIGDPNVIIVEDDDNYCSHEVHLGNIETQESISTADIHNSVISKKRFSSSI